MKNQHLFAGLVLALLFQAGIFTTSRCLAQSKPNPRNLVYIDKQGVLRYTKTKAEAAFFGVNYTVPFAYGYRSAQKMGINPEKAIEQDVYHFARLGLDAFRVHVWDVEISDSTGNLLANEHLRLFDYLLAQLKKRNIKIMITPIAFWGNGYPENDEKTPGFSTVYGKRRAAINEKAIKAQENYISQFFRHVNPYTKSTYMADDDIIAVELNNEPSHSGPKPKVTEYINRLNAALRQTGWDKPIFYNISENPSYADAVAASDVNGFSFQWYPTGLVRGHTLMGNLLPNVDSYRIPFDTMAGFKNKARMVYEFDAGDVMAPYMYPAMARSFRGAGFQWATQFAYDPMATAFANTEYQTHYLNLAYTPSKAISLLIAARVFHEVPRFKHYGQYPQDSLFGPFRVSHRQMLSEMNTEQAFYYSNTTQTKPLNPAQLLHVAGVGSSPVVDYSGYGAYFIDKLADGLWRLEVMPDAIPVGEPFARASLKKEVTSIRWATLPMRLNLPNLGLQFEVIPQNPGNTYTAKSSTGAFAIRPGTYLLTVDKAMAKQLAENQSVIGLIEFVAPAASAKSEPTIVHQALHEVSPHKPFQITAQLLDVNPTDKVTVELQTSTNRHHKLLMQQTAPYLFETTVPTDLVVPGVINYQILIQRTDTTFWAFPGGHKGDPAAWDYLPTDTYQTYVVNDQSSLALFDPTTDRQQFITYSTDFKTNTVDYTTGEPANQLWLKATLDKGNKRTDFPLGLQFYFRDKIKGRLSELPTFTKLVVRANATEVDSLRLKVSLISSSGAAYSTYLTVSGRVARIEVPISSLVNNGALLLPRPYPNFQALAFQAPSVPFAISTIEKIEVLVGQPLEPGGTQKPAGLLLESIRLEK